MMRRRRPQLKGRHPLELLWPFLLLILIGIIVVLFVQFVMTWLDQRQTDLRNKMYFYVGRGVASVLPWGQTEWAKAYHGELVLEGDLLRTGRLSRGVLKFFDESVVRMDADTKLEIDSVEPMGRGEGDCVRLDLSTGIIWLATASESANPLQFVVTTDHLRITSYGTVLEIGLTDRETVRVMEGEALVEILEDNKDREVVVEQIKVGVGQEIEVTAENFEAIYARQPLSLLAALSDDWKGSDWYIWNRAEDLQPTLFVSNVISDETADIVENEAVTVSDDSDDDASSDEPVSSEPPIVTITSPDESLVVFKGNKDEAFILSGTATSTTAKIVVSSYDASGIESPYALKGYAKGSDAWSYRAAYAYGNLREGRNRFTVVAEDEEGLKSTAVEVIVEVPSGTFDKDEEVESLPEASSETPVEVNADSVPEPEIIAFDSDIAILSDESLTPPRVASLNDSPLPADARLSTGAESVTVLGTVSTSTSAVYINNFKLTKYVPGSGEWSYIIRPEFGNFDAGNNTYTVVAEDSDGNKESFMFEIYRVAP